GYIKSLDEKVKDLIPEFQDNPVFAYTSLDHLLQMKSGLAFERTNGSPLHDLFSSEARFYYTNDLKGDLLKVEVDTLAGLSWKYSNLDPLILGWAIENAAGQRLADYFEQTIWQGIGAEYAGSWGLDHEEGLENTPSSFQCTAIDLAKIGRLYLELGKGKHGQVLPPAWIAYSLSIRPDNQDNTRKGWQKATHQNYWWIPLEGNEGDYSAEGLRGQRLYVHPPTKTIIVQFAEKGAGGYPYRKIAKYFQSISDQR
ncbi:MAG: serine hydrolase, partial [Bacteroidota bacterium]